MVGEYIVYLSGFSGFGKGTFVPAPPPAAGTPAAAQPAQPQETPQDKAKRLGIKPEILTWCTKYPSYMTCESECRKNPELPFCEAVNAKIEAQQAQQTQIRQQAMTATTAAENDDYDMPTAASPVARPAPTAPAGPSPIEQRLARLQETIRAKQAAKEAAMRAHREELAKQAAYGRDTEQKRPPGAGYATEAEKLMGGRTGYGNYGMGFNGFGYAMLGAVTDIEQAVAELRNASQAVKMLTKDVKAGVVPKSDLERVLAEVRTKAAKVAELKKNAGLAGIPGFGQEDTKKSPLPMLLLAAAGIGVFLLMRP